MALCDDVINVAKTYMGPAADRFVSRQVSQHLDITVETLSNQHLPELAKWIFISGKLLMDEAKAQEFSDKVKGL